MIAVQMENTLGRATADAPLTPGISATCTRCGKCVSFELNGPDRPKGPVAKRREAIQDCLDELTELCDQRTPWGMTPEHFDRQIPTGVSIYVYILHLGEYCHWPAFIDPNGNLSGMWGGIAKDKGVPIIAKDNGVPIGVPIVVPDSPKYDTAAQEFRVVLVKKGYRLTTLARPADIKLRPKTEKV